MTKTAVVYETDAKGNKIPREITLTSTNGGSTFFSNPATEIAVKYRIASEFSPLSANAKRALDVLDRPSSVIFHTLVLPKRRSA